MPSLLARLPDLCCFVFSRCILLIGVVLLLAAGPARAQIHPLPHADTTSDSSFGIAVALDGDRALVGASGEPTCGENAGAAYVFERGADGAWQQTARLVPETCRSGAFFGRSLALSGDRALVGASVEFFASETANVAYLFERDSAGVWHEVDQLTVHPREARGTFAASVSLDGDRALLTTQGDPAAGNATSGQSFPGAAYIFEREASTGRWKQVARLARRHNATSAFGAAGALDGDRVVVAASTYLARKPGAIYIFERDAAGRWRETAFFSGIEDFFISLALDGDRLLVGEGQAGADRSGRVSVYTRRPSGTWVRSATLRPLTPYASGAFGGAVSLSGDRALITGYDEQLGLEFNIDRVVYVFNHDPASDTWRQRQIIDIGKVGFGASVAHQDTTAIIGHVPGRAPGAAYVVRLH